MAVQVIFRLPWRAEELSVPMPAPDACVADILDQIMDEQSKDNTLKVLNGRVCFGDDPVADGDCLQILPVILGG